ncbi:hypothetical protein ACWCPQ_06475 [Nocardia sp. NPDC001965]
MTENVGVEVTVTPSLGSRPPHLPEHMLDDDPDTYFLSDEPLEKMFDTVTFTFAEPAIVFLLRVEFGDPAGGHRPRGRCFVRGYLPAGGYQVLYDGDTPTILDLSLQSPAAFTRIEILWINVSTDDLLAIRSAQVTALPLRELELSDFSADRTEIGDRETVTLSWRGSDTAYRLYWADTFEDLSHIAPDDDGLRRWTSPALRERTAFMIQGFGLVDGSLESRCLTLAVAITSGVDTVLRVTAETAMQVAAGTSVTTVTTERADFSGTFTAATVAVSRELIVHGALEATGSTPDSLTAGRIVAQNLTVTDRMEVTDDSPLSIVGNCGTVQGTSFTAPCDGFLRIQTDASGEVTVYGLPKCVLVPNSTGVIPLTQGTAITFAGNGIEVGWIPFGRRS